MKILDRPAGDPEQYDEQTVLQELMRCSDRRQGLFYFTWNYAHIYDNATRQWIPFKIWGFQARALKLILEHQFAIILKTRQVGVTWLVLDYQLWEGLFFPEALCLNFSRREDEAIELVDYRIKGMYNRLPTWMKVREVETSTKREFSLSNGSRFKASSSSGSDSYAATFAFIDEAELVEETTPLAKLSSALEPTIGSAGGKMVMISRSDKRRPNSIFKQIFRAAQAGKSMYRSFFIPWDAHPGRSLSWYAQKKEHYLETEGHLDSLYEHYPGTVEEALMAYSSEKRYSESWIGQCYKPLEKLNIAQVPDFPALPETMTFLYKPVEKSGEYVLAADPAEGNPSSDDSALMVFDRHKKEQMLVMRGKVEPDIFANYLQKASLYYNRAAAFPERNNHGHTVISNLLRDDNESVRIPVIEGRDSTPNNRKYGFLTTKNSKITATDAVAQALKDEQLILHDSETVVQLSDINGSTLSASEGNHDDLATCVYLFAILDRLWVPEFSFDILM